MRKFTFMLVALLATVVAMAQTKFWVYTDDGKTVEYEISHTDSISFTEPSKPIQPEEKCKASDYPQVTIGTQTWMAENYRCSKYDTESEAYKEGRYSVPTTSYSDTFDKDYWRTEEYSANLSNKQISMLGYLYNWFATVGLADWQEEQFIGNRQGICPNGWHVPTIDEWKTLMTNIDPDYWRGITTAVKHLKTTSGWYDNGKPKIYPQGLDTYGFAALPAGYGKNGVMDEIGKLTIFHDTSHGTSPVSGPGTGYIEFNFDDDGFDSGGNNSYSSPQQCSVRCLKD